MGGVGALAKRKGGGGGVGAKETHRGGGGLALKRRAPSPICASYNEARSFSQTLVGGGTIMARAMPGWPGVIFNPGAYHGPGPWTGHVLCMRLLHGNPGGLLAKGGSGRTPEFWISCRVCWGYTAV